MGSLAGGQSGLGQYRVPEKFRKQFLDPNGAPASSLWITECQGTVRQSPDRL